MAHRLPPVHWLRAFEAAARHMSFTEAARELGVTQSAISQQIRLLEQHLGRPLFVRRARSLLLTEGAQAFLPAVTEAFERIAAGTAEVFGPSEGEPVTLRVTPAFASLWLAPRLPGFLERHPDVSLRLSSALWPADFSAEGAELEVRYGRGAWPGLTATLLLEDPLIPVSSPALARRLKAPRDLARETLIHTVGFETGWPRWLTEAGIETARTRVVLCDTGILAVELAVAGAGVALARRSFVAERIAGGALAVPFDRPLATREAFHLVHLARRPLRPAAEALRDWLVEVSQ